MNLQPHQQRVVEERERVSGDLAKLLSFLLTPTFGGLPAVERNLLSSQAHHMSCYVAVLDERIALWMQDA